MRLLLTLSALCVFLAGCPDKKPKYPTCASDKDCKNKGEVCVNKKCVQCKADSDCEDGQECKANACVAKEGFCSADADCPDFQICKANQCVACQSDDECAGGRCSEGACLRSGQCVKDEDCADDEDCVDGKCKGFTLGSGNEGKCKLQVVYFDFDTSRVRDDMRTALEANAECLKTSEQPVYIIGHTDPRGTDEYNIALSDGRARTAADYLARFGIDPARFHIVPKGEADATGTDEGSWPQDRRVEFQWK